MLSSCPLWVSLCKGSTTTHILLKTFTISRFIRPRSITKPNHPIQVMTINIVTDPDKTFAKDKWYKKIEPLNSKICAIRQRSPDLIIPGLSSTALLMRWWYGTWTFDAHLDDVQKPYKLGQSTLHLPAISLQSKFHLSVEHFVRGLCCRMCIDSPSIQYLLPFSALLTYSRNQRSSDRKFKWLIRSCSRCSWLDAGVALGILQRWFGAFLAVLVVCFWFGKSFSLTFGIPSGGRGEIQSSWPWSRWCGVRCFGVVMS